MQWRGTSMQGGRVQSWECRAATGHAVVLHDDGDNSYWLAQVELMTSEGVRLELAMFPGEEDARAWCEHELMLAQCL